MDLGKIMQGRDCILNFSVDRNEMSWRNVFLSSTMINKMLDKWQLTVWELWYFKAVNQLSWRVFSSSYSPVRHTGKYKVDLTRHPKVQLAFGERSFPILQSPFSFVRFWPNHNEINSCTICTWYAHIKSNKKYRRKTICRHWISNSNNFTYIVIILHSIYFFFKLNLNFNSRMG